MGEAIIARRGGGKPKPPANYTFLQLITSSLTWTVPNDGWYKIYCVGKSGNGGNGGSGTWGSSNIYSGGGGGAGGNSGGISCSILFLKSGIAIPITVNTSATSFGNYLSATAGGTGGNGANAVSWNTNAGGTPSTVLGNASGGTVLNVSGLYGGAGGWGSQETAQNGTGMGENSGGIPATAGTGGYKSGGGGGSGNNLQMTSINPAYYLAVNKYGGSGARTEPGAAGWGSSQSIPTPPKFSGSGGGGGGGGANNEAAGGTGGLGSPGGIIIEKGVE